MYLINAEAPADEYEHEAENILLRLPEASSVNELELIIYDIFVKCFGDTFASADKPPSERRKQIISAINAETWILWLGWRREVLKQRYGWLHEALVKLLADEDLVHLIHAGAPADEYTLEVDGILLRLPEITSPSILGPIIYDVFVQSFSLDKPYSGATKQHYEATGEKAWALWMRWQAETQQN